jgi:hypothetical protein
MALNKRKYLLLIRSLAINLAISLPLLAQSEVAPTDNSGWWAFAPKPDPFSKDALLNMRYLNEDEAGQSGHVTAKGDDFLLGNGQPVRFWAMVAGQANTPHDKIDTMAARYAKMGINMVRLVVSMNPVRVGNGPMHLDPAQLDQCFYTEAAFKKQGIYTYSFGYYPDLVKITTADGVPDGGAVELTYGEPHMVDLYKSWTKQFLTSKNPYTGLSLGEDPAFAVYEIQNESSIFFFGKPSRLPRDMLKMVEGKFAAWLTKKYGSLDTAFAAWPTDKHPDDSSADQLAGIYDITYISDAAMGRIQGDRLKRLSDEARFLGEMQHDIYVDLKNYIKDELGAKCLVSASNWLTSPGLGFIERYTYSGVDVIDKHGYFGAPHQGPRAGYLVAPGDTYQDASLLTMPDQAPFFYTFLPGQPHVISEIAWNKPNRFIAEAAPMLSAYGAMSGLSGIFNFAGRSGDWGNFEGPNPTAYHLWTYMWPGEIGQSPAEALQFRRGDLKQANAVIRVVTTVDDLFAFKSSNIIEGRNSDFHMAESNKTQAPEDMSGFDPLTYYVGRVERTFDPSMQAVSTDLSKYIDHENKKITSITGEETLDYGNALLTVNSPRSQMVTGFLSKAGPIKLGDVTITSNNEFGTIHVISLDDQPLSTSKKILVQAFTEEKLTGEDYSNGRINALGHDPILIRNIDATVTFNAPISGGTVLDEQGYARGPADVKDGLVMLPKDSLYTIITR